MQDKSSKRIRNTGSRSDIRIWAVVVWLCIWQLVSMSLNSDILLVSPVKVILCLMTLIGTQDFWGSIAFSILRIAGGFLLAVLAGTILGALSSVSSKLRELLAPIVYAIRSIPVASFIILALIWFSSRSLSILISFLMVFPIIYSSVLQGITSCDKKLLEMAQVFGLSPSRVIRYIYVPQVFPFFVSGAGVASGMCWKAGIAAEVIGMPVGSIGEKLQQAKVYLDTPELFAWTLVIVILSLAFERLFMYLMKQLGKVLSQVPDRHGMKTGSAKQRMEDANVSDLKISHISKHYGEKTVLDDFSATFKAGKITAIMAPSGKGKTTLLRILSGLESADGGELATTKLRTSMVFQENRLLDEMNGVDNIRLVSPELSRQKALDELKQMGLMDIDVTKKTAFLSGGMKRRVSLLRALLAEYDLLLLDEPFTGLDDDTRDRVIDHTKELCNGKTVILVTHDEEDARRLGATIINI